MPLRTAGSAPPAPHLAVTLLLILVLGACGPWDDDHASLETTPVPTDQILRAASEKLATLQSARFALAVSGDTFIDNQNAIRLLSAEGVLVRPNRVLTNFRIQLFGGVTVETSLIIIGDQRWSTDLITGRWGPPPDEFVYDPGILFDNQSGLGPVMRLVQSATRQPEQEIAGFRCYHVSGIVDPAVIDRLSSGNLKGSPITVDLWIDAATMNLIRARLAEPPTITARDPATWTLDLRDHGAELRVDPPA